MMSLFDFIDFDFFFLISNGRYLSFHLCGDYDDDDFPFRFLVFPAYLWLNYDDDDDDANDDDDNDDDAADKAADSVFNDAALN